jgi:hypothetical protein
MNESFLSISVRSTLSGVDSDNNVTSSRPPKPPLNTTRFVRLSTTVTGAVLDLPRRVDEDSRAAYVPNAGGEDSTPVSWEAPAPIRGSNAATPDGGRSDSSGADARAACDPTYLV